MSNAQQEPTMEEILASIRRIISEDEEEGGEASAEAADAPAEEIPAEEPPAEEPEAEAEPEPEIEVASEPEQDEEPEMEAAAEPAPEPAAEDDDVLELTQVVQEDGSVDEIVAEPEAEEELVFEEEEPEPEPAAAAPAEEPREDDLISETAAVATASAFAALSSNVAINRSAEGLTLEDIVRETLKPMLKQWLDDNLPSIVEDKVQSEIERVARRRR